MKTKFSPRTIFVIDLLIINACFLGTFIHYHGPTSIPIKAVFVSVFVAFAWYVIALSSNIATLNLDSDLFTILRNTLIGYSVLSVGMIFVVAAFGNFQANNKLILWSLLFATFLSSSFRFFCLISMKYLLKNAFQKSVLLIGGDRVAETVMNKILSSPGSGYRLHGVLADYYHETLPRKYYLGKSERFSEVVNSARIDEVIIALPLRREEQIRSMVEKCENEGIRVRIVPDVLRFMRNRLVMDRIGNIPLIGIRTIPPDQLRNKILKSGFDIVFSLTVLVILSPLYLILALLIKLTSPGPVLFRQERVGANNAKFVIYKFRTMTVQDKKESDTIWTTANDSRVTKIGKFMRKNSLDELPQFWNVLIANMSVVGPRPERARFVEQFKNEIFNYKVRHLVKSGITGLAQVNGFRGDTSIASRVECDIEYVENWSLWLDLKIIWLTLFGNKTHKNAY